MSFSDLDGGKTNAGDVGCFVMALLFILVYFIIIPFFFYPG